MNIDQRGVVLDIGTYKTCFGDAGDCKPGVIVPTSIGIDLPDANKMKEIDININRSKWYINDLLTNKSISYVYDPLTNDGHVKDWDAIELLIDNCKKLNHDTSLEENPILIVEPLDITDNERYKYTEILFETYKVPAIYFCNSAVVSCYGCGVTSAYVIESCYQYTGCIPVLDGWVLKEGVQKCPLGGRYFDEYFYTELVEKKGIVPKINENCNETYYNYIKREIGSQIKQQVSVMSDMPFIRSEEEGNRTFLPVPFTLPDGQQIEVGLERFAVPEILYDPSVPGIDSNIISFTGYISNSVNCLNAEIRKELKSTVVTGGNSSMNGFYDRICREMDLVMNPNTNKMKVINSSENDRNILSWIGGSLLCSINGFDEMWFNKREYNENGVKYLDKKCP